MKRVAKFISILALFALPCATMAQMEPGGGLTLPNLGYTNIVFAEVTPTVPHPNEKVTIVLSSSYLELETSKITWSMNGTVQKSGIGEAEFSFVTGKLGQQTVINVSIQPRTGVPATQRIVINPAEVDLIWEADAYAPPFYEGKSLYADQSDIKVTAIPHIVVGGKELDPKSLMYKWEISTQSKGVQNGYGRNHIKLTDTLDPLPHDIKVTVSSLDGAYSARGEVRITPAKPKVLFYENDPLLGIVTERSFAGQVDMTDKEFTVVAYPYYFSKQAASVLDYEWLMNNQPIAPGSEKGQLTLRNADETEGSSFINLTLKNAVRFFQSATNNLMISYRKDGDSPQNQ